MCMSWQPAACVLPPLLVLSFLFPSWHPLGHSCAAPDRELSSNLRAGKQPCLPVRVPGGSSSGRFASLSSGSSRYLFFPGLSNEGKAAQKWQLLRAKSFPGEGLGSSSGIAKLRGRFGRMVGICLCRTALPGCCEPCPGSGMKVSCSRACDHCWVGCGVLLTSRAQCCRGGEPWAPSLPCGRSPPSPSGCCSVRGGTRCRWLPPHRQVLPRSLAGAGHPRLMPASWLLPGLHRGGHQPCPCCRRPAGLGKMPATGIQRLISWQQSFRSNRRAARGVGAGGLRPGRRKSGRPWRTLQVCVALTGQGLWPGARQVLPAFSVWPQGHPGSR